MKTSYIRHLIAILIWLLQSQLISAQIVLTDSLEQMGIRGENLGILEDEKKEWSISQVASENFRSRFIYEKDKLPVNKNRSSAYWLRFKIHNQSGSDKKWLIEFYDHNINRLQFYYFDAENRIHKKESGNLVLFSNRSFSHKNFEFDLPVPSQTTYTFYVRIESRAENVIMPEIRSYDRFIQYALGEYYLLGIFYGILVMIVIYNLMLFIALRKAAHLLYVFYVISFAVYSMCQNGFAFQYLWPMYPGWNQYAFGIALYALIIFSLLFVKFFLNLREKLPWFNKIIIYVIGMRTAILAAGLFYNNDILNVFYPDLIILSLAFLVCIVAFVRGDKAARYLIWAYSCLFVSFLVAGLENYGIIGSHIITVYSLNIGVVLDILFLSFSLTHQVKIEIQMREEAQRKAMEEIKEKELLKDLVNQELENKVAERTAQLKLAMDKLERQAEEITRANLKLDLINHELKNGITEITRTQIMKTYVGLDEFKKVYSDELSCYRFLYELKTENGFACKKCLHNSSGKGKEIFDRRCNKCGYNESVTANTIFHKLKFPIVNAFYMMYLVTTQKGITSEEISAMLSMRKSTCSTFKKKILERVNKKGKRGIHRWDELILDINFEKTPDAPATKEGGFIK